MELPPFTPPPPVPQEEISNTQVRQAIASQESAGSGGYQARNDASYGPSDPALGKYQILWSSALDWAERYNLPTPESKKAFLNNPKLQDDIATARFNYYIEQAQKKTNDIPTAIRMAAAAWYGGEGNMDNYDDPTPQYGGPSLREYSNSILQKYNGGI
tara:strand:+ start:197 stop:670 length:474 start_codon:yes stop_codon:yes gene_type:complete